MTSSITDIRRVESTSIDDPAYRQMESNPYFPAHREGHVTLCGSTWMRTIDWMDESCLGSAAFWVEETRRRARPQTYRMGRTLAEEISLCLLGGYGVNEAMSTGAFWAVRDAGLLHTASPPTSDEVEAVLRQPLAIAGYARPVKYRFPNQRAKRVAAAVTALGQEPPPPDLDPRELRDWLTRLPGVGLKTASWAARNVTRSDDIAVIDIHIRRAGVFAGVFDPKWTLPRDYAAFEEAFCGWAAAGGVPAADMDACVWSTLARLGTTARLFFGVERLADLD